MATQRLRGYSSVSRVASVIGLLIWPIASLVVARCGPLWSLISLRRILNRVSIGRSDLHNYPAKCNMKGQISKKKSMSLHRGSSSPKHAVIRKYTFYTTVKKHDNVNYLKISLH